ncbi:MAG: hypothetical protein JXR94_11790 [Candidatus Hydrogenedentes bacterium]|nr:hypothetical protein [Candidatus Hydrogenedentota bacterium]
MMKQGVWRMGLLALCAVGVASCPAGTGEPWRSALYPEEWTPAFTDGHGRFLHDFSYAGYANGEAPLPSDDKACPEKATVFDVVAGYGADNTGAADATSAIQSAINAASVSGGVVYLPAGLYRCDGLLTIAASNVVLRGDGPGVTYVYFTLAEGMSNKSHITFQGSVAQGSHVLLASDGVNRSAVVQVADAAGLNVGDDVCVGWVITDEFVAEHNMTGTWQAFNGQWKAFFHRTVTAINDAVTPHEVTLDIPLRYPAKVRDAASLRTESGYLEQCGIESLSVANAVDWDAAWDEVRVHTIKFRGVRDCWASEVESFASPLAEAHGYHLQNCGFKAEDSIRVTFADCVMERAQNRGEGGCGYLFEISRCGEVLTCDCTARKGRHNFIQNWDFGTSGCVWLRCASSGGRNMLGRNIPIGLPAYCEYHHSLTMACLVDQCNLEDGWYGGNREDWSSGAGLTVTQSVYWNTSGGGQIRSWQYGLGYIIGTQAVGVDTSLDSSSARGSEPEDYVEGENRGAMLTPPSLYEDQLARRLGP